MPKAHHKSLEDALQAYDNPAEFLRNLPAQPPIMPRMPAEYSNWRSEQMSWLESCALLDLSHHMFDLDLSGPDVTEFLSRVSVNNYDKFPVNTAKQIIMCNHDGYFVADGIVFHMAPNEYTVVGHATGVDWLNFQLETQSLDVQWERDDNSELRAGDPKRYRYQIQGPHAMDTMRDVLSEEPPQLKFFSIGQITIAGKKVNLLRHGMAGQAGFEIFGPWEDNDAVLAAILAAGEKWGLRRVGGLAYRTSGIESNWQPRPVPAIFTGDDMLSYRQWLSADGVDSYVGAIESLGGSFVSDDITDYYWTPFDLGHGRVVSFNHEFIGRAALQQMVDSGNTNNIKLMALMWNRDDLAEAIASNFKPELGAKYIRMPMTIYSTFQHDLVMAGETRVGLSMWVCYSANYRTVISLAMIRTDAAIAGTDVTIVWGEEPNTSKPQVEPHRQVRIRATMQDAPISNFARQEYRANG